MERENRRTKLPRSALLEAPAEESIRTRRLPGLGFRGPEHSRRAWVIGTRLDLWEEIDKALKANAREPQEASG